MLNHCWYVFLFNQVFHAKTLQFFHSIGLSMFKLVCYASPGEIPKDSYCCFRVCILTDRWR